MWPFRKPTHPIRVGMRLSQSLLSLPLDYGTVTKVREGTNPNNGQKRVAVCWRRDEDGKEWGWAIPWTDGHWDWGFSEEGA